MEDKSLIYVSGRSSGKTHAILRLAYESCLRDKKVVVKSANQRMCAIVKRDFQCMFKAPAFVKMPTFTATARTLKAVLHDCDVIYWDEFCMSNNREDRELFREARRLGVRQIMVTTPRDDRIEKFFEKPKPDFQLIEQIDMRRIGIPLEALQNNVSPP